MSGGYKTAYSGETEAAKIRGNATRPHRINIAGWEDEPASLVTVISGYDLEVIQFRIQDLDAMITLLQNAKTALADSSSISGAAVAPNAAAPVSPVGSSS